MIFPQVECVFPVMVIEMWIHCPYLNPCAFFASCFLCLCCWEGVVKGQWAADSWPRSTHHNTHTQSHSHKLTLTLTHTLSLSQRHTPTIMSFNIVFKFTTNFLAFLIHSALSDIPFQSRELHSIPASCFLAVYFSDLYWVAYSHILLQSLPHSCNFFIVNFCCHFTFLSFLLYR